MKGQSSSKIVRVTSILARCCNYCFLVLFVRSLIFSRSFSVLSDLDENFQRAFSSYLEVRGINQRTLGFLHEYMIAKEGKEYMNWLKNLKNFVEH